MRTLIAVVAGTVAFSTTFVGSAFGEEETVATVKTTTTARAEGHRLMGRISAPFTPRGGAELEQDCIEGRQVEVSIKRPSGYRKVGSDQTSSDGSWSLRVREFDARYRITIQSAEFAYAPGYGQLETVRCLPAKISGRLTRRGFRIDAVLGARFGRASNARGPGSGVASALLPATGSSITGYLGASMGLLALGLAMTRSRGWL